MVDTQNDRRRFSELLPLYVNDTLGAEEQEWMAHYMAMHPDTQYELTFVQMLRDTAKNTVSQVPEQERLARLLNEWNQSRPSPSWLQQAWQGLQGRVRMPVPAIALVTVLVLGQAVVIGSLLSTGSEQDTYRGEHLECIASPGIRVVFNPNAKHVEILLLLRKVEATIQYGPTETGELWLTVPKGRSPEEAQAMLRSSALVDDATLTKESRLPVGCPK